jgi:hypothetical protein
MTFLADASWVGMVGAAASILAVVVTVIIAYHNRRKKTFSYEIISENPLISVDDEIKGKLKILYEDNPIENVHLLLVRFFNSGNIPITAGDYERPLTLSFGDGTAILSAEYVKASPDSLKVQLETEANVVTVKPILMNGGDSFTTKVLLGQYSGTFDVDARIVGVNYLRAIRRAPQAESGIRELLANTATVTTVVVITGALIISSITSYTFYTQQREFESKHPPLAETRSPFLQTLTINELVVTSVSKDKKGVLVRLRASAEGEGITFKWDAINGEISGDQMGSATFRPIFNGGVPIVLLTVTDKYGVNEYRTLRLPYLTTFRH